MTKRAAQRPTSTRAMEDKPKGTDKSQKTMAKTRRTTRSETDSE